MRIPHVDVKSFQEDGFLHLKNVLDEDEVALLRQTAYDTIAQDKESGTMFYHRFARNHLGCLTAIEPFKRLILDDRMVHIAEQLLGGRPCFFGDSIFEIGIGSRGFHKDTSNRVDPNHPDWTEAYPIVRLALYLQDHREYSGGLKVRKGSHRTVKTNVGEPVLIPSEAGDVVAFSLRTSHAGNAVRLKMAPELSLDHRLEKRIPAFLRRPEDSERVSFFLTYGLPSPALDRFIDFMRGHKVYRERIAHSSYSPELIREIEEKVDFIDLTAGSTASKQPN
jgi:ectoine hydroxylase-related dioxygenase (phytanoyl-CoA dioxygenase family)